jgi:uncharacterized 2Fe-2S/4Fe-4S cluster protein (DUF4445 family)
MASELHHVGVRLQGEGDEAVRRVPFRPGPSLRDILASSSARVRSACSGIGACGLCRVRIDEGSAGPPTMAEALHLGEAEIAARTRLACQVVPAGDMDVTVLEPARPSPWRAPAAFEHRPAYARSPCPRADAPLAAAVDVGTTHITLALCDRASGRCLAVRRGENPQSRLGADVIARLHAAARGDVAARELRRWVADAIGGGLLEASREEGIALSSVGAVRVVGNSAMLALLAGRGAAALLDPNSWEAAPREGAPGDLGAFAEEWTLAPAATIELVPPLGGFVGSDLLAGAVHCRLAEGGEPALLVDFGTNTEIALWDGARLWASAAAGGPAFEATGVGCGMAAEPGAIRRLAREAGGAWRGEVLESGPPRGLCGSALVDLLAGLRQAGEIDERGRIARQPLRFEVDGVAFTVSKADIDAMQRAKAAVGAGIEVLLRRAGVRSDRLAAIHVAGTFGEHLEVVSAQGIGLLPSVAPARVHLRGNAALLGTMDLALSSEAERALARVRASSRLVNLSLDDAFEELFLEHLFIRPTGRSA